MHSFIFCWKNLSIWNRNHPRLKISWTKIIASWKSTLNNVFFGGHICHQHLNLVMNYCPNSPDLGITYKKWNEPWSYCSLNLKARSNRHVRICLVCWIRTLNIGFAISIEIFWPLLIVSDINFCSTMIYFSDCISRIRNNLQPSNFFCIPILDESEQINYDYAENYFCGTST